MKRKLILILSGVIITVGLISPLNAYGYPSGYWTYKYIDGKLNRIFVSTDQNTNSSSDTNSNSDLIDNTPTPNAENASKPSDPTYSNDQLSADETKLINLINQERQKAGKETLQVSMELMNAARLKSQDMAVNKYFSHNSPTYGNVWDMLENLYISYRAAAENIAINGSVSKVHSAFMASSGHKTNILSSTYTHVGVGIAKRTNGTGIIITEIFAKK